MHLIISKIKEIVSEYKFQKKWCNCLLIFESFFKLEVKRDSICRKKNVDEKLTSGFSIIVNTSWWYSVKLNQVLYRWKETNSCVLYCKKMLIFIAQRGYSKYFILKYNYCTSVWSQFRLKNVDFNEKIPSKPWRKTDDWI